MSGGYCHRLRARPSRLRIKERHTHRLGRRLELAVQGCQRQAEPDRRLQVRGVVSGEVLSERQMHGVRPGMGHRLVIDGDEKGAPDGS
jgi:hypothetical protein